MPLWIFGYGSLLWRPDFPFTRRVAAVVRDWQRRLDQGSPDHRGTPEALGRVVTLVPAPGAECWGAVYEIAPGDTSRVLAELDHRERGGYARLSLDAATPHDPDLATVRATTWVAAADNAYHLGPAPLDDMAQQIRDAHGPSGPNREYVLRLADALRAIGAHDPHVFEVEDALVRLIGAG